ncbi:NUDIX hydrolase [Microlunatus elymi]|uniref:NUDIX hydrolase n=1 Tax=Microlunatus elymi TaxID=2596828 RepID=A0A516PUC3_9ACTN|nr:NUDIX hydrolase [Microlunatus elymi]
MTNRQRPKPKPFTISGKSHPDVTPRPAIQQVLDHALENATPEQRERFYASDSDVTPAVALSAALAVVVKQPDILLVRPRTPESASWQFPAGVVKPQSSPEAVAVRETLAETGIDCAVRGQIGSRTHPITGVYCVYLLCEYLAGEPENRDPFENINVRWVPTDDLTKFIPSDRIYPPVLDAIKEAS